MTRYHDNSQGVSLPKLDPYSLCFNHGKPKEIRLRLTREDWELGIVMGLLIISCFTSFTDITEADIYVTSSSREGIVVHNGTGISMPDADVSINITKAAFPEIAITLHGFFTIVSNHTQNVTLAFAYPQAWSIGTSDVSDNYTIILEGVEVSYQTMMWEELGFEDMEDEIDFSGTWVLDASFAVFNASFQGGEPVHISIKTHHSLNDIVHEYSFDYIVGSARSFDGQTHQIVHMQLNETEPFLSVDFIPQEYLTLWTDADSLSHALWDFVVQETEINHVTMCGVAAKYHGSSSLYLSIWILPITIVTATIILIVLKKRYLAQYCQ